MASRGYKPGNGVMILVGASASFATNLHFAERRRPPGFWRAGRFVDISAIELNRVITDILAPRAIKRHFARGAIIRIVGRGGATRINVATVAPEPNFPGRLKSSRSGAIITHFSRRGLT